MCMCVCARVCVFVFVFESERRGAAGQEAERYLSGCVVGLSCVGLKKSELFFCCLFFVFVSACVRVCVLRGDKGWGVRLTFS